MVRPGQRSPGSTAQVGGLNWYHTIDLPGGVVTPGYFDQRPAASKIPMPDSLAGKRCLDIGSADGFWAFELERRGAAEVVAIDIDPALGDWPEVGLSPEGRAGSRGRADRAFALAAEALGSRVERHHLSIYDLCPKVIGTFDFVFVGLLLLLLRDPVRALSAARSVVRGELFSVECISLLATLGSPYWPVATMSNAHEPRWLTPNLAGYRLWFGRAGYEVLELGRPFRIAFGQGFHDRPPLRALLDRPTQLLFWSVMRPFGATCSWIRARPWLQDSAMGA